ncbi:hypothetical protein, partial [Burkholderia sp. SIMBA_019]|uniref:hypothetical protein n=1 Tax=Burkholderia sp. SIMBA_019 TaxID=3085765 RepID=UPI00397AE4FA
MDRAVQQPAGGLLPNSVHHRHWEAAFVACAQEVFSALELLAMPVEANPARNPGLGLVHPLLEAREFPEDCLARRAVYNLRV